MSQRPKFRASLLHCARLVNDEINNLLLPYRLNSSLWKVLYVINLKDGCTSIEIADYLNVSKPSIAKRIHALMQLEILELIPTEDKRQKKLVLSEIGRNLFEECSLVISKYEDSLIQAIEPEDKEVAHQVLEQLIEAINTAKSGV
jgi:DNA-binding MarR family transcriptional regulator